MPAIVKSLWKFPHFTNDFAGRCADRDGVVLCGRGDVSLVRAVRSYQRRGEGLAGEASGANASEAYESACTAAGSINRSGWGNTEGALRHQGRQILAPGWHGCIPAVNFWFPPLEMMYAGCALDRRNDCVFRVVDRVCALLRSGEVKAQMLGE